MPPITTTTRKPQLDHPLAASPRPSISWPDLIPGRRYRFLMTSGQSVGATFYGWGTRVSYTETRCNCGCGAAGQKMVREPLLQWGHFLWDGKASDGQPAHQLFDVDQVMPLTSVVDLVERIEEMRQ